ncbi:hypothetical protein [Pantoea vagans]|uniref:hypothetical protein n=1 Tax=Pantoea vagans TaxID=470934 RepID=UPI00289A14C4|nr:hypothetical protein [Pantoea vagans]
MAEELSAAEYKVRLKDSRIVLEDKTSIKEHLGKSPNDADALALTFAFPVVKKLHYVGSHDQSMSLTDYDPYQEGDFGLFHFPNKRA